MEYTSKYIHTLRQGVAMYRTQIANNGRVEGISEDVMVRMIASEGTDIYRLSPARVKQSSLSTADKEEWRRYFLEDCGLNALAREWMEVSEANPSPEWGEVAEQLERLREAINDRMVAIAKMMVPQEQEKGTGRKGSATDITKGYKTKLNICFREGWMVKDNDGKYRKPDEMNMRTFAAILGIIYGGDTHTLRNREKPKEKKGKRMDVQALAQYFGVDEKSLRDAHSKALSSGVDYSEYYAALR